MIDEFKKLTGLRLKEALVVLDKYPKCRYLFKVTKDPRQGEIQITEEFRVLRITEVDKGLVNILVCI